MRTQSKCPHTTAILAATLHLAHTAAAQSILTGPIVNPANGHYYYLLSPATWADSQAAAVRLGGNLVTVSDAAENNWLFDAFNNFGGGDLQLWTGFTDEGAEGAFRWVSGEAITFTGWGVGEPNNGNGGAFEHYAYIVGRNSGQPTLPPRSWNDGQGSGSLNGVVEIAAPTLSITIASDREATLSWTPAMPGFVLQQNSEASATGWTDAALPAQTPQTISTTPDKMFYRLIFRPAP